MCEPTHSIVQYPDQDSGGNPTDSIIKAIPIETKDGGVWQWLRKKIGSWFHFSKLGNGHSEAIGKLTPFARRLLPDDTKYEALWWNRTVKLDGRFYGEEFDKDAALQATQTYAEGVSIGSLTSLRRFLEVSMLKSERAYRYVEAFVQMLNKKGADAFNKLLKRYCFNVVDHRVIKFVLGFTRKRELLVPEWADDTKLWLPV